MYLKKKITLPQLWHQIRCLQNVRIDWVAKCKNVPSDISARRRLKSASASAQSERRFRCLHKKWCIIGYRKRTKWWFWSDCANAQANQNLHRILMYEGTFSDVTSQLFKRLHSQCYSCRKTMSWRTCTKWSICIVQWHHASRNHTYIILTPLNPTFI